MAREQDCVNVSVRMPVDLLEEIDAITSRPSPENERKSRGAAIRDACCEYVRNRQAEVA